MKNEDTIKRAIEINHHIPLYGDTQTYEVREIKGVAENGDMITGCLTPNLKGYIRIPKRSIKRFVDRARDIIARETEIRNKQQEQIEAFRNR